MLTLSMFLQHNPKNITDAQDIIQETRAVTGIAPQKLTSTDIDKVATILERVGAVLQKSRGDSLTTKVRCTWNDVNAL